MNNDKDDEAKFWLRQVLLGLTAGIIVLAYVAGASRGWKTRSTAGKIGKSMSNVGKSIAKIPGDMGKALSPLNPLS
jgi:hypothetical protein